MIVKLLITACNPDFHYILWIHLKHITFCIIYHHITFLFRVLSLSLRRMLRVVYLHTVDPVRVDLLQSWLLIFIITFDTTISFIRPQFGFHSSLHTLISIMGTYTLLHALELIIQLLIIMLVLQASHCNYCIGFQLTLPVLQCWFLRISTIQIPWI